MQLACGSFLGNIQQLLQWKGKKLLNLKLVSDSSLVLANSINLPVSAFLQDTALDPGEDVALLSVSFEDAEATQVFPKLYLSPSIEQYVLYTFTYILWLYIFTISFCTLVWVLCFHKCASNGAIIFFSCFCEMKIYENCL